MTKVAGLVLLMSVAACQPAAPVPVAFDAALEPCRFCRMVGSSGRFAAQIVAPGDEALFFDDLGCLRSYLADHGEVAGRAIFVVDHRTGAWTNAHTAMYVRQASIATPMGSHLLAFASAESRDFDADARGSTAVPTADVLGSMPPPPRAKSPGATAQEGGS